METLSSEELRSAYQELESRCMTRSASWVLEFLFEIDPNAIITQKQENVQISFAKTLFRNGEFKRAQQVLQKNNSQISISLRYLSKLLDTQRQLTQNIPEDSTFIADLPVSTQTQSDKYAEIADELIKENETTKLDDLNMYLLGFALAKSGSYEKALDALLISLNGFPLNYCAWKQLIIVLVKI